MALPPFEPDLPQTRIHFTDSTVVGVAYDEYATLVAKKRAGHEEHECRTINGALTTVYLDHVNEITQWDQSAIDAFKRSQEPERL